MFDRFYASSHTQTTKVGNDRIAWPPNNDLLLSLFQRSNLIFPHFMSVLMFVSSKHPQKPSVTAFCCRDDINISTEIRTCLWVAAVISLNVWVIL